LNGSVRRRFYADVANFGAAPDAARQVAAGYICLALVVIWMISTVATALAYQAISITTFIPLLNAGLSCVAFSWVARRRDPRRVIDWLVLLYCGSAMIAQYTHSTLVAPMVMTLPVMAAIAVLYQRPLMRPVGGVAGTITVGVCPLAALGVIGTLPSQSASARVVMVFAGLLATVVTLFCVAVMEILAREYVHDQLRQTNSALGNSASRASTELESARVGLWDVPDAAHPRFLVTDSFRAITGYTSDEFNAIFVDLKKFIHADDVSVLRDAFAGGQERMSRIRVDFRMLTKTCGYRWFSARALHPQPGWNDAHFWIAAGHQRRQGGGRSAPHQPRSDARGEQDKVRFHRRHESRGPHPAQRYPWQRGSAEARTPRQRDRRIDRPDR